jgi:hypothetical protein
VTDTLVVVNATILLGCTSIYLGTGVSLVFFQYPGVKRLTPENYYDQFVPQVQAATRFFTVMTSVMFATAGVMIWSEWGTWELVVPILLIVLVAAATLLTVVFMFRYNGRMAEGITDVDELQPLLARWMRMNRIRVSIWATEWLVIAIWFAGNAR